MPRSRVSEYQLHRQLCPVCPVIVEIVGSGWLAGCEGGRGLQPNQTEILDVLLTYRRGEEGGQRWW